MLELCHSSLDTVWSNDDQEKYKGTALTHDLQVLHDIASGLAYIHSKNLVHRDIKPQNLLISFPDKNGRVWIKVADYGHTKSTTPTNSFSLSKGFSATQNHASPETIQWQIDAKIARDQGHPLPPRANKKTDVFSAGIVFFELKTRGVHPFGNVQAMIPHNIHTGEAENIGSMRIIAFCI